MNFTTTESFDRLSRILSEPHLADNIDESGQEKLANPFQFDILPLLSK